MTKESPDQEPMKIASLTVGVATALHVQGASVIQPPSYPIAHSCCDMPCVVLPPN